jgi:hypothetical protein
MEKSSSICSFQTTGQSKQTMGKHYFTLLLCKPNFQTMPKVKNDPLGDSDHPATEVNEALLSFHRLTFGIESVPR